PHRRALVAHLVRAHVSPRLRSRAQLRWVVDGMGERRAGSDRAMTAPTSAKPVVTTTRAVWRGEHRFDAGPEGRTAPVDADSKTAPGPVETLLNACATCSGVDVLDVLAKRRTPAEKFVVKVKATRRSEAT